MAEQKQHPIVAVSNFLNTPTVMNQLAKAFPLKSMAVDRFIRQAMTLCSDNPKLMGCTHISLLSGMMKAAELGLELTGALGQAYLVPRWNSTKKVTEATFQVGYRGLVDLAFRSGRVSAFPMQTVYSNEPFEVHLGSRNELLHTPLPPDVRGDIVGYYSVVRFLAGGGDFCFMYRQEVEEHMRKFAQGWDKPRSAWQTNPEQMGQKTTCKRLCKRVPLSPEAQYAAILDDIGERGLLESPVDDGETPESRSEALGRLLPEEALTEVSATEE